MRLGKAAPEHVRRYWEALGRFIDAFAAVETHMQITLWHYADVTVGTARAIFSGVRTDTAASLIRRLMEVNDPGDEARKELTYLFKRLDLINTIRNDIVHYGARFSGGEAIVSTALKAHTQQRVRETTVSPEILDDLTYDLRKIVAHLSIHRARHKMPDRILAPDFLAVLRAPWRYRPVERYPPAHRGSDPRPATLPGRRPKHRDRPRSSPGKS
jgi:hypothetical protein